MNSELYITDRIPLGVIPPEADCAKAVLAFLSDYSAVITGSSVDVNGGEYMAPYFASALGTAFQRRET